jgi:nicotinate-nucleotide adenylyltransferase
MRLGIFGGTFDPPHLGHLILAEEARFQLNLFQVLWVLTPSPPHKDGSEVSPWEIRRDLVSAAIEDDPQFELSTVDIDRPPPHYAYETLDILHESYPGAELIYLMGGDSLRDLPGWERPPDFLTACDAIGVMRRPSDDIDLPALELVLPGVSAKVRFVEAPLLEISGSEIRRRAMSDEPIKYYLPRAVFRIIQELKLYGYTRIMENRQ